MTDSDSTQDTSEPESEPATEDAAESDNVHERQIEPDPDHAWKALGLVNDWIKHADAKVGATLAGSGVVAVLLYNLVKNQTEPGGWLSTFAVSCAVATVLAGVCSALALMPRLTITPIWQRLKSRTLTMRPGVERLDEPREDPVNLLFFSNIAKQYKGDSPTYVLVLHALTADPNELTKQIAHQVHANATVAHRKFTWADRATKLLSAALVLLAVVALIVGSAN